MKRFFHDNGGLLLIAALLLTAVLALGSFILGFHPITAAAEVLATPFRAASTTVASWVEDWYSRSFRYDEIQAELDSLRQQLSELRELEREYQEAILENERMKALLGLAEQQPQFRYTAASVTRRSSSNWTYDLTVNQGTGSGVALDDCVIDQYGNLVGVVSEVGVNWALVTTIVDPDMKLGGRVARTDSDAILEGDFALMPDRFLKLTYLPEDAQLAPGDQVTTSGLGGVYPAGLLVGVVQGLYTEADGVSRYAKIRPAADVEGVKYVYVITDYGGE